MEELIEAFSLDRVGKAGAKFDPDKAKWFNQEYLKTKTGEELALYINQPNVEPQTLAAICEQMKERVTFAKDIPSSGSYFFAAPTAYDAKTVKKKWKEKSPQIVADLVDIFDSQTHFTASKLEQAFKNYLEAKELGMGIAMIAIRLTVTGVGGGPNLFEIMQILGKDEALARMKQGIEAIEGLKVG